jgi:hypothetical protein
VVALTIFRSHRLTAQGNLVRFQDFSAAHQNHGVFAFFYDYLVRVFRHAGVGRRAAHKSVGAERKANHKLPYGSTEADVHRSPSRAFACRTYGALRMQMLCTQRLRAGLSSVAPLALAHWATLRRAASDCSESWGIIAAAVLADWPG